MVKHVVILSAFLSPLRGGAETMVEEVAIRLERQYTITIVTAHTDPRLSRESSLGDSVRVVRVGPAGHYSKYFYPLAAAWHVRRLQPGVVHAVLESYAGLALILCRFFSPRSHRILTLQSTNTTRLLKPMHRIVHVLTAISSVLVSRAASFGRTDVILIPNGVDVAAIRRATETTTRIPSSILFAGRLEPMKGVDTLLDAFALLRREAGMATLDHPPTLRIAGDGTLRTALEAQAAKRGLADAVTFLGRLAPQALYEEYAQAEIFCGLSRSEALGNVFLEAQAAGCAVVATRVGGIPEIISDQATGLLVPPDDPRAAADALKRLLTDPALRITFSRAGQQRAEQFDWEQIARRYAALYKVA